MPFPSNEGNTTLEDAWSSAMGHAGRIKRKAQSLHTSTLSSCTATLILNVVRDILSARDALAQLAGTPGLEAYARDQIEDPTLNLAVEYNAMIAAINAVRDWVFVNIPKEAVTGYLLIETLTTELVRVDREFSSVSLGGLRTVLDTLIASIN